MHSALTKLALLASVIETLAYPAFDRSQAAHSLVGRDVQYIPYHGDGSAEAGWPSMNAWASYDQLWAANSALMSNTCDWNKWGENDTPEDISAINAAIQAVSGETGVDNRFILAIMMQETKGCVRAPTTNNGVVNPGLMQSHNGQGSCAGISPCPVATINQMISDGVAGTSSGDGLQQTLGKARGDLGEGSRAYYSAARLYNSGSADYNNLNNGLGSTPCYASDVANRLTGWTVGESNCDA